LIDLFRRGRLDRDLDEEIRAHLDMLVEENRRRGLSDEAARTAAFRSFGGVALVQEDCRREWGLPPLETWLADARYGLRSFRRNPGFAAAAALSLALGIGANTAIFSVVHAVLIEPLPYQESDELVMVWERTRLANYRNDRDTPAPGNFQDWKDRNRVFTSMAAIGYRSWNVSGMGAPIRVEGEAVSASLFPVLRVGAALGRVFTPEEDRPGGPPVALLGHGLWTRHFGADPRVVGRSVLLDGQAYTVVGVMPQGFRFPDADDQIWVPIDLTPQQLANRESHYLRVVARLRPGVSIARAQQQMDAAAQQLAREHPDSNAGVGVQVVSLRDQIVGDVRPALLVLLAVVGVVLTMVCVNVGTLLLARASTRRREFAVRRALGASRARLARQVLTEGLVLSCAGGGLGLLLAVWGVTALRSLAPADTPRFGEVGWNGQVVVFHLAVAFAAGLLFGAFPAVRVGRSETDDGLRDHSRSSAASSPLRMRSLLVVAQAALGVVVLMGAGLLLRSFRNLQSVPLGFRPEGILTFRVILRGSRYAALPDRTAFYRETLERIEALPGVRSAASVSFLPLTFAGRTSGILVEGRAPPPQSALPVADFRSVTPEYFRTMGIPRTSGRDFAWSDMPSTVPVAVVSEGMASAFWPSQQALGKRFTLGTSRGSSPLFTVVGVVGNVRQLNLADPPRPAVYFPASQDQGSGEILRDWVVRTGGDPSSLFPAIAGIFRNADPDLPISRVRTMHDVRAASLGTQRFGLRIVGLFGLLALALAVVGLYGVLSYTVARRTHELAIRMALGAGRAHVLRLVLGQGARLTLLGVAIGAIAALAATRALASLLYGVGARDPLTFVAVSLIFVAVALVACAAPVHHALRVDPITALKCP
jgi:putative ABC transport system permease protein